MTSENIKAYAKEHHEEVVSIIKDLCAIPAPSGFEERRAEYCKRWFESIGAEGVYIDSALNCVCPINIEGKSEISVFVAHTDTVFPDTERMPYSDDGEYLRSPGVGDDTSSLAVMMLTVKYIIEKNITLERGALFVANSSEEGLGNLKGTRKIFEDYKGRIREFISFDSALGKIESECVGSHRYEVRVKTEGGHSYLAFGNKSAIDVISRMICEIYSIIPPKIDGARVTYNVGCVNGGTSVNTIAESAEMLCEYRSSSAEALKIMKSEFEKIFNKPRDGAEVSVSLVGDRPCAEGVDADAFNALLSVCASAVEDVTGAPVRLGSSSTDCNIPLSLGIPALCIGVYIGGGAHTRGEWVKRDSLIPGLELCIKAVIGVTKY